MIWHRDPRPRTSRPTAGRVRRLMAAAFLAALMTVPGLAAGAELPAPTGKVVLSVTGMIRHANDLLDGRRAAHFDRTMFEALGASALKTTTFWTKGEHLFEGVDGRALLDRVGAHGSRALATALNDYQVEIPLSDFTDHAVMLALKQDGEYLKIRNKGPIWVIYPAGQTAGLAERELLARSVWQLRHLEIQ
ncbi:MAG: molybdopterin-dependent oxidoreductase [Pseudomonadota bacterium]